MHINKMMIIKVAADANVAITITKFLSSPGGFRLNGLSEPLLTAIAEVVETLFDTVVEGIVFRAFTVVVLVVVVVVVVMLVILTDVQGVSFIGPNRDIGS